MCTFFASHAKVYQIGTFSTLQEFLHRIAAKKGKMRQKGRYDYEGTARAVLTDWNQGKIPFFTLPPKRAKAVGQLQIANGWAKEFDLNAIASQQTKGLEQASRAADDEDFISIAAARR